ncbi:germin-like protein 1-4 [Hordeum vulgare subsp. vulgare]|uniref:Germin-like protein n=1 Tax=Hordeum vulgare subsp. vulgare TaxID=112509 RepID=A0A8I6XDM3_HORVV|nr:germin-like protein 1-4 [Hordeum vulgare subsp. vulgare]
MAKLFVVLVAALLALRAAPSTLAGDPGMLQDLCVADYNSVEGPLRVNGYPCKQAENVTADDFFYAGLASAADVYGGGNPMGSVVTAADAERLPGLNTLGVSMSRVDYAPWGGTNPPHAHPRATEILFVAEGTLEVGFVTTAGRHITRAVPKGGVFVFPRSMMHYERSVGEAPAVAISAFDSQLPGTQRLGEAMFGAAPAVPTDVLARALRIDGGVVESIRSKFQPN